MTSEPASNVPADLKRDLTVRYVIGLIVIAGCVLLGAMEFSRVLTKNAVTAEIINTAGAQRMLSQRAALLSFEVLDSATPAEREHARARLVTAMDRMEQGARYLTSAPAGQRAPSEATEALQRLYAADGGDLKGRVERFIDTFRAFNAHPRVHASAVRAYRDMAQGELLADLDLAVRLYEEAAEAQVAEATRSHLILTALLLMLLAFESAFIFRPLVKTAAGRVETAESELADRSALLSRAFDIARMGYWRVEKLGENRIWISEELAALWELDRTGWMPARGLLDEGLSGDTEVFRNAYLAAWGSMKPQRAVTCYRLASGRVMYALHLITPEIGEDGEVSGLVGVVRDVTDEEVARRDLLKSQALLERRAGELSEAHRLGQIGTWRMAVDRSTIAWSEDMFRLLKLDPEHFQPGIEAIRPRYQDDSLERVWASHEELLRSGQPQTVEIRFQRGDGEIADFELRSQLEYDADGRPTAIFGTAQDISSQKRAERDLEQLAYFDHLTGLANRALCQRELKHACQRAAHGHRFALCLIDLDHFKETNDSLGHEAGDELLALVAQRLTRAVGPDNLVARLGGDEFAILVRTPAEASCPDALARGVLQSLSGSVTLSRGEVSLGASMGVCRIPMDTQNPHEAMRFADLALYSAKQAGRNRFEYFNDRMSDAVRARMSLAVDLRHAIDAEELETHFQPLVDVTSDAVMGFETLVRWKHPQRGYIPPSEFVPIAESSHLIAEIGAFVMNDACRRAKTWIDAGLPPREVSVNVSAAQLLHGDLEGMIGNALDRSGLPPEHLCIELTESVFASDALPRLERVLGALKARGVRLALDDFGTGYSSLGYLNRLPFDKLKVDRCFISAVDQTPEKRRLLEGIVGLARGLGMQIVAEGVETRAELEIVRGLGCHIVQGYFYGRPMPEKDAILHAADLDAALRLGPFVNLKTAASGTRRRTGSRG